MRYIRADEHHDTDHGMRFFRIGKSHFRGRNRRRRYEEWELTANQMSNRAQLKKVGKLQAEQVDIGAVPFDLVESVRGENRGSVVENLQQRASRPRKRQSRTDPRAWAP